jgi:hypothetical protein
MHMFHAAMLYACTFWRQKPKAYHALCCPRRLRTSARKCWVLSSMQSSTNHLQQEVAQQQQQQLLTPSARRRRSWQASWLGAVARGLQDLWAVPALQERAVPRCALLILSICCMDPMCKPQCHLVTLAGHLLLQCCAMCMCQGQDHGPVRILKASCTPLHISNAAWFKSRSDTGTPKLLATAHLGAHGCFW